MDAVKENDNIYKRALLLDKQGEWAQAHEIAQDLHTQESSLLHAYLHRKEGDERNAKYWYQKAGKEFYKGSLAEEWRYLWELYSL